ncbi:MAG: GIY-YIG nuclease family protein [Novosphingobium sp.]
MACTDPAGHAGRTYAMIDARLQIAIREAWPAAIPVSMATADGAPHGKGAYALVIALRAPVTFAQRGTARLLPRGVYVYAGSAHGPGGIGARLRHHFRREKLPHWHVDRLTTVADEIEAFAIEGGRECEIVARLGHLVGMRHQIAGFGSSDCRTCPSHLLRYSG